MRAQEVQQRHSDGHDISTETRLAPDLRSLVPRDTLPILESAGKTARLFAVDENPRLCGWGAEVTSIVTEDASWGRAGPTISIITPHMPLPAADNLGDPALPSAGRIVSSVRRSLE